MLKIIRCVLYGLAISTGVAGLFVGGVPIAKYALERFRDSEYGYYYETNFLFSPEVIFLLSLILLIFVHIGLVVGKGIHVAGPTKSDSSAKPAQDSPAPAGENSPPATTIGKIAQAEEETADEKLTRLLNQKKD